MQLTLQSQIAGDVVILRCRGRIVSGEESKLLQSEVDKLTQGTKKVVLQLAETNYVDSGGLGALVRLLGVLRAGKGDLKLCQLSPFVTQVLQATNLLNVFRPYGSEKDAVDAFSVRTPISKEAFQVSSQRIVCLDPSLDLLAYLKALLKGSGYQVFTTQYPSDAAALLLGAQSGVVICGPGMHTNEAALAKFRQGIPGLQVLNLPPDFSASEADHAGPELVNRVRALLPPNAM